MTRYATPEALYSAGVYKRRKRYYWANGNLKFACYHTDINAAYADTDWECWKHTEDDAEESGPLRSAITDEATLLSKTWNI